MKFSLRLQKLDRRQKRLWEVLIFLLKFTALSIPLYLILVFHVSLLPLQYVVADQTAFLLEISSVEFQRNGILFHVNDFWFLITEDCLGWKSMLAFLALVLAVPKVGWKNRGYVLALGLPLIWLGNLARIIGLVFIEKAYGIKFMEVIHTYLWSAGLMALVLGIWGFWLFKVKMHGNRKKHFPFF